MIMFAHGEVESESGSRRWSGSRIWTHRSHQTNTGGHNAGATFRGLQTHPDSGAGDVANFYFNEVLIDIQTIFTAIYDVIRSENGTYNFHGVVSVTIILDKLAARARHVQGLNFIRECRHSVPTVFSA